MLALVLGLIISAGLYFAYLWPSIEPVDPAESADPAHEGAPAGPAAPAEPPAAAAGGPASQAP